MSIEVPSLAAGSARRVVGADYRTAPWWPSVERTPERLALRVACVASTAENDQERAGGPAQEGAPDDDCDQ